MRTTLAIDDDLFEKLRHLATKRRIPFTRLVNEMLRRALSGQRAASQQRAMFRVEAFERSFWWTTPTCCANAACRRWKR